MIHITVLIMDGHIQVSASDSDILTDLVLTTTGDGDGHIVTPIILLSMIHGMDTILIIRHIIQDIILHIITATGTYTDMMIITQVMAGGKDRALFHHVLQITRQEVEVIPEEMPLHYRVNHLQEVAGHMIVLQLLQQE